jgi:hypothetical protein
MVHRMVRGGVAAWLLAVALGSAGDAHAADTVLARAPSFGHVELAGDRVVTSVPTGARRQALRAFAAGRAPQTLLTAPADDGEFVPLLYAASAERAIAVLQGRDNRLVSLPFDGPPTQVDRCPWPAAPVLGAPAAGGPLGVWGACTAGQLLVQDASTGTSQTIASGNTGTLAAAAPYAAWIESFQDADRFLRTRLVVFDAAAGAVAYRVDVPPAYALAVQSDGTAVVSGAFDGSAADCPDHLGGQVAWFSVAEPTAHVTDRVSCGGLAAAGGRVAVAAPAGAGATALSVGPVTGGPGVPVARYSRGVPPGAFDFDGISVTWVRSDCRGASLLLGSPDAGRPVADAAPPCPIVVGRAPRLGRDGALRVRLTCRAGCQGTLGVVGPGPRRSRLRAFDVPRGSRSVRIALGAAQRRAVRRLRHPVVGVTLRTARGTRTVRRAVVV